MKLLPVYGNNVMKSQALAGVSDISVDNRAYLMHLLNSMSVSASCAYFYPRLIPLHNLDAGSCSSSADGSSAVIPNPVRCSADKLEDTGCYLLENGLIMALWIGQAVSPNWMQQVFAVDSANQLVTDGAARHTIPVSETALNVKLRTIISAVRSQRNKFLKVCFRCVFFENRATTLRPVFSLNISP